jgi:octanoyl-[GcvH]:protein N-octanoyltransferase
VRVRVVYGREATPGADYATTQRLADRAAESGESALRVWTPHRQLAFGRRDARAGGYERARDAAERYGYPPVERRVGGRAVAYTGSTLAVVHAIPGAERTAIESRYAAATERLARALATLGVDATDGEPDDSFCPGAHSLQAGGKLAGVAQHVRSDVALVAGIVVVRDRGPIADVLGPVYGALGVPFDPESVGSVAAAGGPADPATVRDAIVDVFGDESTTEVERL